jgi:pyruvate ferredoxin oxidoreductase alpha subunit
MAQGTAVLGGAIYSYFRYQQHLAQVNALDVHQQVADEFQDHFGRHYGLVEPFQLDDADYVLVMSNAFATKGKAAVQRLRAQGVKAGLLRLRVLRPFPAAQIADVLENRKAVALIDQNLARGKMRAEDNVDVVVVAGDGSTYDMARSYVSGAIFRDLDFWYCLL